MSAIHLEPRTFEPALFSAGELQFLLDHVEETPVAALHKGVPTGVNPAAITKILTELQEYDQIHKAHRVEWAGFEAIKDSILRFIAWQERCAEIYRRTGGVSGQASIKHASQYAWDAAGGAFKYGIDSDSAEMVRTEILDDGSRRPFGVRLMEPEGHMAPDLAEVAPWIRPGGHRPAFKDTLDTKASKTSGTITCSICGKAENFNPKVRSTQSAARARMGRHLKQAREDVSRHRLLHRKEFESPSARA